LTPFSRLVCIGVTMNPPHRWSTGTLRRSTLFAIAVVLAGCVQTPDPPTSTAIQDEYLAGPAGEPVELSYTFPGDEQPTQLTAELVEGVVLIEGDIALGTYEELTAAGALTPQSHGIATSYWPASTATPPYVYEIPYEIADDFSQSYIDDVIEPAIQHWNDSTAIAFVERSGETDYVEIVTATNRCWSAVGRKGGRQEIRLDESGCTRIATVVHELGHTVGLKHEQQRTDRDTFVEIVWDNIQTSPDRSGNFRLFGPGLPLGEYGYTSIMHYGRTAFGQIDANGNRMTTIRTLGPTIAPSTRLSDGDLAGVRRLYPETDLPFADITEPEAQVTVDEGDTVTFEADAVIDPALDDRDLLLSWTYDRNGVPFTFGSNGLGESSTHRFCDGVHDVTVAAILPSQGELATDTVRVVVNDLGTTNPPDLCAISVSIDEPLDGTVFAEGATVPLSAVIDDDHPETDVPLYPVIWRLDDPDDGTIIGTGLQSSTKLGAGQHTIHVAYGSASDAVTVTVQETGTAPTATISSPADESLFNWFDLDGVNTHLDVAVSGSASDAQDGALTGASLVWEVRQEGVGSFQERGTGTDPVLRFPMQVNTVRYDVRLTAVDSDGMTDSVTIQIAIIWPPS